MGQEQVQSLHSMVAKLQAEKRAMIASAIDVRIVGCDGTTVMSEATDGTLLTMSAWAFPAGVQANDVFRINVVAVDR